MISQFCSHSRSALHPPMTKRVNAQLQTQTMMKIAEVIEATHNVHTCYQSLACCARLRVRRVNAEMR